VAAIEPTRAEAEDMRIRSAPMAELVICVERSGLTQWKTAGRFV
jgi:predicted XRE-type DNA-binding protein